jgi:hypothetical protein
MSTLQESAMLVSLNISQWTARKHDKAVSAEVDRNHGAKDGGRFNKQLIAKEALDPIAKIEGAARAYFYKVTHAWGDNGERMLPAALFMEFGAAISGYRSEFDARVREFLAQYPRLQQEARVRLGSLYDPADYPADIKSKFAFPPVAVTPVASANDFRVKLNDEYVESIKASITSRHQEREDDIVRQCWARMRTHLAKIVEVCENPKSKIFESLMENPREYLAMLPALNLTNDAELARRGEELRVILVPADRLKQDKGLKADLAVKAAQLLQKLPSA